MSERINDDARFPSNPKIYDQHEVCPGISRVDAEILASMTLAVVIPTIALEFPGAVSAIARYAHARYAEFCVGFR